MLSREFDLLGSQSELDKAELALTRYYKEGGKGTPLDYIRTHGSLFDIDDSEKEALAKEFGAKLWESDKLSNVTYDGKPFNEWEEKPEVITVKRDGNIAMYQLEYYGDGKSLVTKSMDGQKQHVRFRGMNDAVAVREVWHVGDIKAKQAENMINDGIISAEIV